jgi:predicted PurR-regulated permease PerM
MLGVFFNINGAIAQYLSVKVFISLVIALFSTLVLWLFGVDFFIVWGMLTFFANFIPYVGSTVAGLFPVVLSLIQFGSLWVTFPLALILFTAQQLTGNLLEPKLHGARLDVSPVVILLSLAFWGSLWGVTGMVLSVPLVVSLRIALENIEQTKPIAKILSNV